MHPQARSRLVVVIGFLFVSLIIIPWMDVPYRALNWVASSQPYEPTVTVPATGTPTVTLTPTTTPSARAFLPLVRRDPPITPTAPASIRNGGFEEGAIGWDQASDHERTLIRGRADLPIVPHRGDWAAWLGGVENEVAGIGQTVTVPSGRPMLAYWLWIDSEDDCEVEVGGVVVGVGDDVVPVDGYWLCRENNTAGWIQHVVDLGEFAGQTVNLLVLAENDTSGISSLFIDDLSFEAGIGAKNGAWNGPTAGAARQRMRRLGSVSLLRIVEDGTEW